ncbi:hypothetical protein BP5796_07020 [Coleophoma crateriformis]|uniref:Terpene synthase n=1 Tax=Coleophoma crateriformis TaxID=565419 RepID=A0A3D8RQ70_9HELO|nr:hypothetical protein BP5796_07020 [Coleophoma crateriformis]
MSNSKMNCNTRVDVGHINISIPFQSKISDDLDRARHRHLNWIADFGLWPDKSTQAVFEAADFPSFVAHVYPWATGSELDLLTDFIGWAWLWDDLFDKSSLHNTALQELVSNIRAYDDIIEGKRTKIADVPMMAAFRQLINRINSIASEIWRERHCTHWKATFRGFEQEAENNARKLTPTMHEYLSLRRAAAGTDVCFDWIEAAGHFELPAHIHADPIFLNLRFDAQDVVNMTNDIFSADNESRDGNTDNLILVLTHHQSCSSRRASELAHEIIAGKIESFQRHEREFYTTNSYTALAPQDQVNTVSFIDSMKYWMRGSLEWHLRSPRYKSV